MGSCGAHPPAAAYAVARGAFFSSASGWRQTDASGPAGCAGAIARRGRRRCRAGLRAHGDRPLARAVKHAWAHVRAGEWADEWAGEWADEWANKGTLTAELSCVSMRWVRLWFCHADIASLHKPLSTNDPYKTEPTNCVLRSTARASSRRQKQQRRRRQQLLLHTMYALHAYYVHTTYVRTYSILRSCFPRGRGSAVAGATDIRR